MSHIIKAYWSINDQNGNSIDGVMYNDPDTATSVMNTLLSEDQSLTLSVVYAQQILY
jgi:hypothetical protein